MVLARAYGGDGFVGESNDSEVVYIKGNENTNGSLRIIPDTSFQTEAEFQLREDGVWNDTGILIAASTVYLGRELQISGGGEYMLTKDSNTSIRSLIPHVRFNVSSGTEETVVVPKVGVLNENVIIQPDNSGSISGEQIQFEITATDLLLANRLILQTTSQTMEGTFIRVSLFRSSDYASGLFYQRTYPIEFFIENMDVQLDTDGLVELMENETFYVQLDSDGTMYFAADATNTIPYFGGSFYELDEDTITPDEFGGATKFLTFDNDGHIVCDNAGNAVLGTGNGTELEPPVSSIGSPFGGAAEFTTDANTDKLDVVPVSLYRFTGTGGATLTLDDNTKEFARDSNAWIFTVKDEGGDCTANPLTIAPESGTIDGAASIQIVIDYGSVVLYSDGTNFWSM